MRGGQQGQKGYDQAVTLFSPDGSLYQVQYAKKAVKRGSLSLAARFPEGFVFLTDGGPRSRLKESRADKVLALDEHLGCVTSGLVGDGRVLIDRLRRQAQQERMAYGEPMEVHEAVRSVGRFMHEFTRRGGSRPFGVSLLLGGARDVALYVVDPGGSFAEMEATAIGQGSEDASAALKERRDEAEDRDSTMRLCLEVLRDSIDGDLENRSLEAGVGEDGSFSVLGSDEVREELEKLL